QASIHRIDVDHPSPGQNYSVPADNPFVKLAGARPEIWAYGLRNIWKMSFDRQTGELWGADVGQDLWESVFHLEKGGNYGWSVFEGTHTFRPERKLGPTPVLKPVVEHDHSQFRSITGGFVYRGKRLPDLFGNYVYADFETGKIWAFKYDHQHATAHRELADTPLKIVGFGEAADGELLILDYLGHVHRLVKNETRAEHPTSAFPRKLSQTGLFADTKALLPAAGLIPYSVNSPLWSDGAQKARFMAVPGMSKIDYHPTNGWGFPQESVLVKTFSLDLEAGNPASRRRLETRILQLEHNRWRGYTYLWNDEQTDATLLEGAAGLDRKYTIRDAAAPGGKREQVWHYPSRAECTLCHTMPTGYVLGPSTLQLNRDQDYGGTTDNQLRTLEHIGMFKDPILQVEERESPDHRKFISYDQLPKLPDPRDPAAPLEARARSYLHANCAHCHMRSGGGNALFWLPYEKTLAETATLDVLPLHGDLGIPGARLLVAGSPEKSLIYERMLRLDAQRMPRVASSVVDQPAVKLIKEWIKSLPPKLTNGESPEK
ncbi:MAG TPA: PQQ-dependent sugar dehydrogenase, partial [Pirellulales bacterium]|nr:PQQ-dependent sugar dehydrogenase [Pirellulales bacterium]